MLNNVNVTTWNMTRSETCESSKCIEINRSMKIREAQLKMSKNGKNNFQKQTTKDACRLKSKQIHEAGLAHYQTDEFKLNASKAMTERNIKNNPMKCPISVQKMKVSSTGKILSKVHKQAISSGLSRFIQSLSDEDFKKRLSNSFGKYSEFEEWVSYDTYISSICDDWDSIRKETIALLIMTEKHLKV
jgi:hypothetical protein